ncbi:hypothetical protein SSX86_001359 [Deinandra increscens subsp. villosa]|uniref:Uncharacterized protein n=1 Tax=Deinandra increscens subsp. villosa TaxID=3103831 RepID=A0AAP0DRJ9_9ASTR
MPREVSDHCPIILDCGGPDFGPIPFKCYNSWHGMKDFDSTVRLGYAVAPGDCEPDRELQLKLKNIKKGLKSWWINVKEKEFGRIKEAKKRVDELEVLGESRMLTDGELQERLELVKSIAEWEKNRNMDIKQKAKIKFTKSKDLISSIWRREDLGFGIWTYFIPLD